MYARNVRDGDNAWCDALLRAASGGTVHTSVKDNIFTNWSITFSSFPSSSIGLHLYFTQLSPVDGIQHQNKPRISKKNQVLYHQLVPRILGTTPQVPVSLPFFKKKSLVSQLQ